VDATGYPTQIITTIWKDIQARSTLPQFAITTGDSCFASPSNNGCQLQMDVYLKARAIFANTVFFTLGNHECTGATASNCGPGQPQSNNFAGFMSKYLGPIGKTLPYYSININASDGSWTAKFVFMAMNAWDSAQAAWLPTVLAQPTTYTFLVRHEGSNASNAPGVLPSDEIIAQYPYTLMIRGHTHTYQYNGSNKEVVVGNGGAPITGGVNYGYVIAEQQVDGSINFTNYDYSTNAVADTFGIDKNGTQVR
jgi:hypothetical protein